MKDIKKEMIEKSAEDFQKLNEDSKMFILHLLLQEDTGMRMDSRTQIFSAALPLERTLSLQKNTFIGEPRSLFPDICILEVIQTKTGLKFIP